MMATFSQLINSARQKDLPAPVGPFNKIGAFERKATRSIRSIIALKFALRVAIPDFKKTLEPVALLKTARDVRIATEVEINHRIDTRGIFFSSRFCR